MRKSLVARWSVAPGAVVVAGMVALLLLPVGAAAAGPGRPNSSLRADLAGKPLELGRVGQYFCHDFAYPQIHCFADAASLDAATTSALAVTAINYVTIYSNASFNGSYMHLSENYSILATIGWNDRISSFIARNSQSGVFWVDWFYGSPSYSFCCNSAVASLGSYDETFSSVYHN